MTRRRSIPTTPASSSRRLLSPLQLLLPALLSSIILILHPIKTAVAASSSSKLGPFTNNLRLTPDPYPFHFGVGSADPYETSVLLWTHVTVRPDEDEEEREVEWRVWEANNNDISESKSSTSSFDAPIRRGTAIASSTNDYTITIEVTGLEPGTKYHYQFHTTTDTAASTSSSVRTTPTLTGNTTSTSAAAANVTEAATTSKQSYDDEEQKNHQPEWYLSRLGTTQTIPTSTDSVKVASLSCTSLWSGYFNMYRHLSHQTDVNMVLHLGDFVYPDIDPDEIYRVPAGLCKHVDWFTQDGGERSVYGNVDDNENEFVRDLIKSLDCNAIGEQKEKMGTGEKELDYLVFYRWMYKMYLLDPDFRDARSALPFVVQLDNHDLHDSFTTSPLEGSRKAALEWVPQRYKLEVDDETGKDMRVTTLRHFRLGTNLVDVVVMDTYSYSGDVESKKQHGLLGDGQHEWLDEILANSSMSNTTWRILGTGKSFMPFAMNRLPSALALPLVLVAIGWICSIILVTTLARHLVRYILRRWYESARRGRYQRAPTTSNSTIVQNRSSFHQSIFDFAQRERRSSKEIFLINKNSETEGEDSSLEEDEEDAATIATDTVDMDSQLSNPQDEDEQEAQMMGRCRVLMSTLPFVGCCFGTTSNAPPDKFTTPTKSSRCCTTIIRSLTLTLPIFLLFVWTLLVYLTGPYGTSTQLHTFNAHPFTWEGQAQSMIRLWDQLEHTQTDSNNVWLSGDMHYCYASNVYRYDHNDSDTLFHPNPSQQENKQYGVELLPCSGTRGNIDEMAGSLIGIRPHTPIVSPLANAITNAVVHRLNPHYMFYNGQEHGYGIVTVTRDRVEAKLFTFPILEVTDVYRERKFVVKDGENQWEL